jgi:Spy/CpxP family protein refolding chaperone
MRRTLLAVAATLMITATLFAQGALAGPLPEGQRPNPLSSLKNALALTDTQVQAIKSLAQTEKARVQPLMTDIRQKRQALNTFLNATSPNPADVGVAAIVLNGAEKKLSPERDYFISQLKTLLTGDQQQKLDTLLAANGGRLLPFPGLDPGFRGRGGPLQ